MKVPAAKWLGYLVSVLVLTLGPTNAFTQTNGEIRYSTNILEYWNGISWTSTDVADTGVSCSTASPGEIRFNTAPDPDRMEFCNGTNWRRMDGTVTAETCTTAGEIEFKTPVNQIRFCNGGNWVNSVATPSITCPTGYIPVPADGVYTTNDFCVAKYEMKNDGSNNAVSQAAGNRWAQTHANALSKCQALGAGYDLISNPQWQTIARNVADVDWNWSTGTAYSGEINSGNIHGYGGDTYQPASTDDNDACYGIIPTCSGSTWAIERRTHKLSNNQIIWDLGGNDAEWVSTYKTTASGADGYIASFTSGDDRQMSFGNDQTCGAPGTTPYCRFGYGWTAYTGSTYIRGGYIWEDGPDSGIFLAARKNPTETWAFRCVYNPAPVTNTYDVGFNNVVLLIQPDANDTTIDDLSASAHTITAANGAALSTSVSDPWVGSRKIISLDGSNDHLLTADSNDWYQNGDYTYELWAYFNTLTVNDTIDFFHQYQDVSNEYAHSINNSGNNGLGFFGLGGFPTMGQGTDNMSSTGTWHHIAFTRSGDTFKAFVDGVALVSAANAVTINNINGNFNIGGDGSAGWSVDGHITGVRITKGVARYTGNFIPPTLPFPTSAPPVSPIHHWKLDETSGTTINDSGSGTPINGTFSGAASVTSEPLAIDGTGLVFDGSNDWIDVPNTGNIFQTVPLTWSMWVKFDTLPSGTGANVYFIRMEHTSAPWNSYLLWSHFGTDTMKFSVNGSGGSGPTITTPQAISANTWYHVAGTIDAAYNFKLYFNGALIGEANSGSLYAANGVMRIGGNTNTINNLDGRMDDVRFYNKVLTQAQINALSDGILPDTFDFSDVYGASLSTLYYVAATVTGFDGPLTASVTGGDAQVRKNSTGAWGSSVAVSPGDILNLRMTSSGSASTAITATVTLGAATADWIVSTGTGPSLHYFVRSSADLPNGNLGGLAGANATCLTDLQNNNWKEKGLGPLNGSTVKAFLCDGASCQNLQANKTYKFAQSGDASIGGASFTTDGSGLGPGDNANWSGSTYFGSTGSYWSGRGANTGTLWSATSNTTHCLGWTSNSNAQSGTRGNVNTTTGSRWAASATTCDNSTRRLVCFVDTVQTTDDSPEFSFVDTNEASLSAVYEESTILMGFAGPLTAAVTSGTAEIRVNGSGSWVTSGLVVNPGDTLNIRMTSSSSVNTTVSSTVTIGSASATWNLRTDGPTQGYFVLFSSPPSGNLGGLSGANAYCLTQLQNQNWLGKTEASIQGQLTASNVKAWLCDETTCTNLEPNKNYAIADARFPTAGGRVFTATASGYIPDDNIAFQNSNGFGGFTWYITGRDVDNTPYEGQTCNSWTSSSAGLAVAGGVTDVTFYPEKLYKWDTDTCASTDDMICFVNAGPVDAPAAFDFSDVYGATTSTVYYAAAVMSGFDEAPLTATVSGADAQIRKNSTGAWGTSVSVSPGDILNIRMTSSASANTAVTATVIVNWRSADWIIDTSAGAEFNYFVRTSSTMPSGDLGGLSGANATCLSDLQSNDWMGKSNVSLDSGTVKAFLCDGTTCQNTLASKTYTFAASGDAGAGSAQFTTDGSGLGPGDANAWSGATYFNSTSQYWSGRASTSATLWANTSDANHCSAWTSNATTGRRGAFSGTDATRWTGTSGTCGSSTRRLICLVDYTQGVDQLPNPFYFLDTTDASTSTQYEESTVVSGFVGPTTASVSGNGAEIRANHTGSWVTSGLTVYPGDTINVRMTSSASSSTEVTTTVTVGTGTAEWSITTASAYTTIFITSGTTWAVPADWNNNDNTIEVIGGGGGGNVKDGWGGGGGGGGGYSKVSNVTLSAGTTVTVAIGSGGTPGVAGGDTYVCNSTSNCATIGGTAVVVGAKGGGYGLIDNAGGGAGGSAAAGVGTVKYSGGNGGVGLVGTWGGSGGGGGAAGPSGDGQVGGNGQGGGGGGGGSNGGSSTAGVKPSAEEGGNGGHGTSGTGGGAGGPATGSGLGANGTAGGGGGGGGDNGSDTIGGHAGAGGMDTAFDATHGAGGGGGGGGDGSTGGNGGNGGTYGGGGGGGSGASNTASAGTSGSGAQGIIVIRYSPINNTNPSATFDDVTQEYLSRTFPSAGNRKQWTFSVWFKRDNGGFTWENFLSEYDGSHTHDIGFNDSNQIEIWDTNQIGGSPVVQTTASVSDTNWHHLVVAYNTTLATTGDRVKIYLDGVRITAFAINDISIYAQNEDTNMNKAVSHYIGRVGWGLDEFYDGRMSEYYFIDGQELTPTDFGYNDSGTWRAKPYTGSFGTNGFYLFSKFQVNGNIGVDLSGNGNNWTPSNMDNSNYDTATPP